MMLSLFDTVVHSRLCGCHVVKVWEYMSLQVIKCAKRVFLVGCHNNFSRTQSLSSLKILDNLGSLFLKSINFTFHLGTGYICRNTLHIQSVNIFYT